MTENISEYLKKIPEDFTILLKGIGNKLRFSITLILIDNGPLSFTRITKIIKKEKALVASHIKKLELSGVVQNYLKKDEQTREFSFYKITKYGKKMILDLIFTYNKINESKIDKLNINFINEIPEDFQLFLKSIENNFRFALCLKLIDKGSLSFSEIVKFSEKAKSENVNHLKKLELGGIIQNFYIKNDEQKDYSFYKITHLGKEIINNLVQSYNEYYEGITSISNELDKKIIQSTEIELVNAGCGSWALPNENVFTHGEKHSSRGRAVGIRTVLALHVQRPRMRLIRFFFLIV